MVLKNKILKIYSLSILLIVLLACGTKQDQGPIQLLVDELAKEAIIEKVLEPVIKSFTCPYSEKRSIYLSSATEVDELNIEIVGEDCDEAKIVLTVTTANDEVIHTSTARALDYTYELTGSEGVESMLNYLLPEITMTGADLPGYAEMRKDSSSKYYYINKSTYQNIHQDDLPIFCHTAGKSYEKCFVYLEGKVEWFFDNGS